MIPASQPEILRASLRDEAFKKQLSENVSNLLQDIAGIQIWIKYKDVAKILSDVFYYSVTTLSNLQTLGEEYTGIIQVNPYGTSLPNRSFQLLMILFNNCGEKILNFCLLKFENKIKTLPKDHPLQESARIELLKISMTLRSFLPIIEKANKAIFYFNGDYYEISKRICGIRYALVRYWLKKKTSFQNSFKLLGIITMTYVILRSISLISNYKYLVVDQVNISKSVSEVGDIEKCPLCLNPRKDTSVTPCGHLFCWSCILSWLQEQPKCPICRLEVKPSRVVFLQNYSCDS